MNKSFKSIPDKEKQGWRDGYDLYVERMNALSQKPRPFKIWLTDFGITHE